MFGRIFSFIAIWGFAVSTSLLCAGTLFKLAGATASWWVVFYPSFGYLGILGLYIFINCILFTIFGKH